MDIRRNVKGELLSTYKGGGEIEVIFFPETENEFALLMNECRAKGKIPYILGGGSDTIICDGVITRPVICTRKLNGVYVDCGYILASAGAKISRIIGEGRKYGLGGLEFLSGVPATIGGATRMNAGAYSAEIKDYIEEVSVLNSDYAQITIPVSDVEWGHRKGIDGIIIGVKLRPKHMTAEQSHAAAANYILRRKMTQPDLPSVGSVFKCASMPAGYFIDKAGLKGERIGGAEISCLHANFIVNTGGGSTEDFISLALLAEKRVYEQFGVRLEREFKLLCN